MSHSYEFNFYDRSKLATESAHLRSASDERTLLLLVNMFNKQGSTNYLMMIPITLGLYSQSHRAFRSKGRFKSHLEQDRVDLVGSAFAGKVVTICHQSFKMLFGLFSRPGKAC